MPDKDLLDRMTDAPGSGGDKLKEILNPSVGGEAARLRNKLAKLWGSHQSSKGDESVERMKARNAALRLSKNVQPRRKDNP